MKNGGVACILSVPVAHRAHTHIYVVIHNCSLITFLGDGDLESLYSSAWNDCNASASLLASCTARNTVSFYPDTCIQITRHMREWDDVVDVN